MHARTLTLARLRVWCGRFKDDPRSIIVFDATDASEVRTALADAGPCAIDGLRSNAVLRRLITRHKK